jgi:hypothetical protein
MFDKKVPEPEEVFHVKSYSGSVLRVFQDRVVLTQEGVRGVITRGLSGEKTIYYSDISSVQFRKCGLNPGILEFTFPGSNDRPGGANSGSRNENRFEFSAVNIGKMNKQMEKVNTFVQEKVRQAHAKSHAPEGSSSVDTLLKLKSLLDAGALTKEEFETEKRKVLAK